MCNIPVLPVAASIIEKYKNVAECTGKLLPILSNQRMNSYLKEIVCGLYYLKCNTTVDGKEIHFSDLANAFEKLVNIKFGDIYKKEEAVIKRKPIKITEFLDRMKAAIIQKSKDEGYYQP